MDFFNKFSGFAKNVGDKTNDFARNIGDKTSEAMETRKLHNKINTERNAAAEDLKKIGEYYYNLFAESDEEDVVAPEVLEFCQSAKAHYDVASQAQEEIDRIKAASEAQKVQPVTPAPIPAVSATPTNKITCSSCGTANHEGTKFCQNCGNKLEMPKPVSTEKICSNCGASNDASVKFCRECGNKLEVPAPAEPEKTPEVTPVPEWKFCPQCGAKNKTEMKFCGSCGKSLV